MLYEAIARKGLTVSEFARLVKVRQPNISEIRRGARRAPRASIEKWADVLSLKGEERERFLDLAALTHAPERIQQLVLDAERALGQGLRQAARGGHQ
jgi:transcriptional regulator with XRE-family HTH domain